MDDEQVGHLSQPLYLRHYPSCLHVCQSFFASHVKVTIINCYSSAQNGGNMLRSTGGVCGSCKRHTVVYFAFRVDEPAGGSSGERVHTVRDL